MASQTCLSDTPQTAAKQTTKLQTTPPKNVKEADAGANVSTKEVTPKALPTTTWSQKHTPASLIRKTTATSRKFHKQHFVSQTVGIKCNYDI
eukprot:m.110626 g.110626  ORF g.110626 m.110626 type:complete len:92 (-) comp28055_c0_seq4:495-770(-)